MPGHLAWTCAGPMNATTASVSLYEHQFCCIWKTLWSLESSITSGSYILSTTSLLSELPESHGYPWDSRREPELSSTAHMKTAPHPISLGISKNLGSILSSLLPFCLIWKKSKTKDWTFHIIRKPNTSPCTSQTTSLETLPCTSVLQGHSAPQAPAVCPKTCHGAWSHIHILCNRPSSAACVSC